MDHARLSNAELRRLEGDSSTSPDDWRAAVAELARREAAGQQYTPASSHPKPRGGMRLWNASQGAGSPVILVGLDVPFWDLVGWLVKVSLAAIPAMIIATCVAFFFVALGSVFLGGVFTAVRTAIHR